ncbi:hypothetical protein RND81_09G023200 [Saponaria officinalis]|uniref:Transcription factor TFIIIC triple barrel domain-containing protein n=1 Tax=Saponaria officinalis TaxID=3572 RepID=A0AAW1IG79_SAPOF
MELDNMVTDDDLQEEYVLLDLDAVCGQIDIPPNEPYTLSGLDTLNPILTIGDKLKLIGEYEETIGTCLIFSENETAPTVDDDRGSSRGNHSKDTNIGGPNQVSSKQVKPITSLQKILKFRLLLETDEQNNSTEKPPDAPENVEAATNDD